MRSTLCFHRYVDNDWPEFEAMVMALYAEDAQGEPMTGEKIRRTVEEFHRHPDKGGIVIFCSADAVVGYAVVVRFWSNEYGGDIAVLDEIYVKPSWRGRGVGTAFLDYATSAFGSVRRLQVEVTPANQRAFAYYLDRGFSPATNRRLFKKLLER